MNSCVRENLTSRQRAMLGHGCLPDSRSAGTAKPGSGVPARRLRTDVCRALSPQLRREGLSA